MKSMRISVIIPVYNREKYIEQAVRSVLLQPDKEISVILVDDGSTDLSPKICDNLSLKSNRVTVIHTENGGVSKARNTGIDFALSKTDSDYIAFLDSDDVFSKSFFDGETAALLEEGFDLLCFSNISCNNDLSFSSVPQKIKEGIFNGGASCIRIHDDMTFAAVLYSSNLLRRTKIRFFEGLNYAEDKIFVMQCLYAANAVFQKNKVMYLRRSNPFSAMTKATLGADYFLPMIKAYIKSDKQARAFKTEEKDELFWGRILAASYTVEMIKLQSGHDFSFKKINSVLTKNPEILQNLELFSNEMPSRAKSDFELLKNQKRLFLLKSVLAHFKLRLRKAAKKSFLIYNLNEKRKFGIKNEYN